MACTGGNDLTVKKERGRIMTMIRPFYAVIPFISYGIIHDARERARTSGRMRNTHEENHTEEICPADR